MFPPPSPAAGVGQFFYPPEGHRDTGDTPYRVVSRPVPPVEWPGQSILTPRLSGRTTPTCAMKPKGSKGLIGTPAQMGMTPPAAMNCGWSASTICWPQLGGSYFVKQLLGSTGMAVIYGEAGTQDVLRPVARLVHRGR